MKPYSLCLFLGKRNTGKSTLLKDILCYFRKIYPAGKVISGTDHLNHFYDKFIPGMLIHRNYESSIIDRLFKRQEKAVNEEWQNPGAFLIMDDCLADDKWQYDPLIRRVFFEGRHYKLWGGLCLQANLGVRPELRQQIDYVFILRNNILKERRKIHEHYCGMMDYETFDTLMQSCTDDYGCLVVDNLTKSNKLEDQIFYYKAEPHDDLRMCHEDIWKEHERNYKGPQKPLPYSSSNSTQGNSGKKSSSSHSSSHSGSRVKTTTKEEFTKKGRRITISKKE